MTSVDLSSQRVRASRGRTIVVGSGDSIRELAAALRRILPRVSECGDLYRAIDDVGSSTAREPVSLVVVPADCEGFDAAACADAFRRVDPSVQLVLAVRRSQEEIVAGAIAEGFEDSITIPPDAGEIRGVLEGLGLTEPPRRAREAHEADPAPEPRADAPRVPEIRNVVEIAIKDAQARASAATDTPAERPPAAQAAPTETGAPNGLAAAPRPAEGTPTAEQGAPKHRVAGWNHPPQEPSGQPAQRPLRRTHVTAPPAAPDRPKDSAAKAAVSRAPTAPSAPRSEGPPGDLDLVRALLSGEDFVAAALRVLQHHIGSDDVRFATLPRPGEEAALSRERQGLQQARVECSGGCFGVLVSSSVPSNVLAAWAVWLGQWMLLEETHRSFNALAFTDELTGAGNRRSFDKVCAETMAAALAERRSLSLMYFDIDDFKQYNDRHGHEAGDEVLRETVELLQSCIRRGDRVFRVGGDEFVVLFCDTSGPRNGGSGVPESVESIAKRFQRAVAELRFPNLGIDGPGTLTISAGVAVFPWEGADTATLLRRADMRALESKRAGKNLITFGPGTEGRTNPPSVHPPG